MDNYTNEQLMYLQEVLAEKLETEDRPYERSMLVKMIDDIAMKIKDHNYENLGFLGI